MLNGTFCAAQFLKHQAQVIVRLGMIGLDAQELLIALNSQLKLTFLVGNHAQHE